MTHPMTPSSPSRLVPLGMLLWCATPSALPLHTIADAPYETDGPAAHDLSLRPFGRGAHPDFERMGAETCANAECCKVELGVDTYKTKCEDITYKDAGRNCNKYTYKSGALPPCARAYAHASRPPPCARGARGPHSPRRADTTKLYQACRDPTSRLGVFGKRDKDTCKSTAKMSTLFCRLWHDWYDYANHGRGWTDDWIRDGTGTRVMWEVKHPHRDYIGMPSEQGVHLEVVRLSEWCGKIAQVGNLRHCLLLIELKNTIDESKLVWSDNRHRLLVLEQEAGEEHQAGGHKAVFTAHYIEEPEGMTVREMTDGDFKDAAKVAKLGEHLRDISACGALRAKMELHRAHVSPAPGAIQTHTKGISYRHATDLTFPRQDDTYPINLISLRKLTVDYANFFPKYDVLTTNCQMYSTTMYNILTNTDKVRFNGKLSSAAVFGQTALNIWSGGLSNAAIKQLAKPKR